MTELSHPVRLSFKNISKFYGDLNNKKNKNKRLLDDIDLTLTGGECLLITGKNGSGKSTLLRIIGGLLKPKHINIQTEKGSLNWQTYRKLLANHVMYLYQEPYMFDGTVRKNLSYALSKNQSMEAIDKALQWVDLAHRTDTQAKVLSGGERQRLALAQAWLKQPAVLLLDEPTANLDSDSRERTESLLERFKLSGTALCIASHDPNHFKHITDRCLHLENGKITE